MNALAKRPEAGGNPLERMMVKIDPLTFSRVQSSEYVRLRVLAESGACLNFMLKNMNSGREGSMMALEMKLSEERLIEIANPVLKVIFHFENVLAPFTTIKMGTGNLFSAELPFTDAIN